MKTAKRAALFCGAAALVYFVIPWTHPDDGVPERIALPSSVVVGSPSGEAASRAAVKPSGSVTGRTTKKTSSTESAASRPTAWFRCVDRARRALAAVDVVGRDGARWATDSDGVVEVPNSAAAVTFVSRRHAIRTIAGSEGGADRSSPTEVVLANAGTVRGRVVDQLRAPLPGAQVRLVEGIASATTLWLADGEVGISSGLHAERPGGVTRQTVSGANGEFQFEGVAAKACRVGADLRGFAPLGPEAMVSVDPASDDEVEIMLSPLFGARWSLRTRATCGFPHQLAGAVLVALSHDEGDLVKVNDEYRRSMGKAPYGDTNARVTDVFFVVRIGAETPDDPSIPIHVTPHAGTPFIHHVKMRRMTELGWPEPELIDVAVPCAGHGTVEISCSRYLVLRTKPHDHGASFRPDRTDGDRQRFVVPAGRYYASTVSLPGRRSEVAKEPIDVPVGGLVSLDLAARFPPQTECSVTVSVVAGDFSFATDFAVSVRSDADRSLVVHRPDVRGFASWTCPPGEYRLTVVDALGNVLEERAVTLDQSSPTAVVSVRPK